MNPVVALYQLIGKYLFLAGLLLLSHDIPVLFHRLKTRSFQSSDLKNPKVLVHMGCIFFFVFGYLLFASRQPDEQYMLAAGKFTFIAVMIRLLQYTCAPSQRQPDSMDLQDSEVLPTHYLIKPARKQFWLYLGFTVASGLTLASFILIRRHLWPILFFSFLTVGLLMTVLHASLWKIEVNGSQITYRTQFGQVKTYQFDEISNGILSPEGALKIYSGEENIFTFDADLDFTLFLMQMDQLRIPIFTDHSSD